MSSTVPRARFFARLTPIILILSIVLCACGGERDLFAYQRRDLHAPVHGEWRGTAFEGELTYIAPVSHTESDSGTESGGETTPAAVTLAFTSPAAWQGITLTWSGGRGRLSLGELTYDWSGEADGTWFELLAVIAAQGTVSRVDATDGGTTRVTFADARGNEVTLTLEGEHGEARRWASSWGWMEVGE